MNARVSFLLLALAFPSACSVGPDYVRPDAPTAATYKEAGSWKIGEPGDTASREQWWAEFDDTTLDGLEHRIEVSNQDLAAAQARFRQARALVEQARAAYFPNATIGLSAGRSHRSANAGFSGSGTSAGGAAGSSSSTSLNSSDYVLPIDISWEADVWGRVRRSVESSRASAQASAADVAATLLSLRAECATDYFTLRSLDSQQQLLDDTVKAFEKSLQVTKNRYSAGVAARTEVAQAETQLENTRTQAIDVGVQRAQVEHAIAVLVGTTPSDFSLAPAPLRDVPPPVPPGLPSELLEQRPDVAAGERRVAAANAQIGVAQAAYYPDVTLSASGGLQSAHLSDWFTWPSRFWSVGPSISETVFDGGLRHSQTRQARAAYDAEVAAYRKSVLTGFQEVEDSLAALRILENEAEVQQRAVASAEESVRLTINQYKAGIVSYLNVVVVQATALSSERDAVVTRNRRMAATVQLIKALGGGWTARELPSDANVSRTDAPHVDTLEASGAGASEAPAVAR
ncbi:MAG TPA: efflux transporter outer membrane subunit [Candidatus Binatia bacterium]|jgi:NodT family efflux transporter outer membrane factor (OMF) lipoprotein